MEHLVRFMTDEGREGTHTAASLEDALHFVERLRNSEGAGDVRVYRLREIPIEFKTYYRVEVRAGDDAAGPHQPNGVTGPPPMPVVEDSDAGSRRLFSRA